MGVFDQDCEKIIKNNYIRSNLYIHLYTFLCEIEFTVNQRPLTAISDDIKDYDVLTPNHFIKGETNADLTTGQFDNSQINYRKKGKTYKPQQICYGIVGEKNIYQH